MKRRAFTFAAGAALAACAEAPVMQAAAPSPVPSPVPSPTPSPTAMPPPPPRELRAAWVATVANIDWPTSPGLPVAQQRAEALAMLDRARAIGLNALILQVRPAADAIYPSALEPFSEYVGGTPWDALAFWVEHAHRRGIELHAWFNPYRARHSSAKLPPAANHVSLKQPAIVRRYGDMLWLDPGEAAAAQQTLAVVADVLARYDVDGVHIDDYFYPYPVVAANGIDQPFPDDEPYARYQLGGGLLARDDWRRANVDALVQALHALVRRVKPQARLSISPFGIGKPGSRPVGITGFSQYDKLYADVERWLAEGWLDELVPQLYWPIDREGQRFPVLLDYWLAQNPASRRIVAGLFTSQVRDDRKGEALGPRAWPAREIVDQVLTARARGAGQAHFSMAALMNDRDGVASLLQLGPYAQPALVPATPWLPGSAPPAPRLRAAGARVAIDGSTPAVWAAWRRVAGDWRFTVLAPGERMIAVDGADAVAVAAVGRTGLVGETSVTSVTTPMSALTAPA